MLLHAPSRGGLVAPNPVVAWLATLSALAPLRTSFGPSPLGAKRSCRPDSLPSPVEKWVLIGQVARGPGFAVQLVRGQTDTHRELWNRAQSFIATR